MMIEKRDLQGYGDFLKEIKERIRHAQIKAAIAVNRELVTLYWQIGQEILKRQEDLGWGAQVIDRLSVDLRAAFPDQDGFSPRNLRNMKRIAELWPDEVIWQQLAAKLPWGHNIALTERCESADERVWYASMAVQHGWSRSVLYHHLDTKLISRQGQAPTNFGRTLPEPDSDLAQQLIKDPYNFQFLTIDKDAKERELEQSLITNLRDFLMELGAGFAFVGRQHRLDVGGEDFYPDLLFYHLKLHCYIVIDLKIDDFKPEYSGKMQFYVAVVDDKLRDKTIDGQTIGLILCRSKKHEVVEYALRGTSTPIGVSSYQLPNSVKEVLAVDEIKQHILEIELPGDRSDENNEP